MMKDTDSSGVVKYKGFQIDMLKRVAEMANFDYTLFITPDNLYGTINKTTQTWNGMIGEIIAKVIVNDEVYMFRKLLNNKCNGCKAILTTAYCAI